MSVVRRGRRRREDVEGDAQEEQEKNEQRGKDLSASNQNFESSKRLAKYGSWGLALVATLLQRKLALPFLAEPPSQRRCESQ